MRTAMMSTWPPGCATTWLCSSMARSTKCSRRCSGARLQSRSTQHSCGTRPASVQHPMTQCFKLAVQQRPGASRARRCRRPKPFVQGRGRTECHTCLSRCDAFACVCKRFEHFLHSAQLSGKLSQIRLIANLYAVHETSTSDAQHPDLGLRCRCFTHLQSCSAHT